MRISNPRVDGKGDSAADDIHERRVQVADFETSASIVLELK